MGRVYLSLAIFLSTASLCLSCLLYLHIVPTTPQWLPLLHRRKGGSLCVGRVYPSLAIFLSTASLYIILIVPTYYSRATCSTRTGQRRQPVSRVYLSTCGSCLPGSISVYCLSLSIVSIILIVPNYYSRATCSTRTGQRRQPVWAVASWTDPTTPS